MTEYWVSKSRHRCDYCNCWTQPDPMSIKRHEESARHKGNVQKYLKDKKQGKIDKEKAERDRARKMKQIEEAAQAQLLKDKASLFAQPQAPPPPPPGAPVVHDGVVYQSSQVVQAGPVRAAPEPREVLRPATEVEKTAALAMAAEAGLVEGEEEEGDSDAFPTGYYRFMGNAVLEGKYYSSRVRTGQQVEVRYLGDNKWYHATILTVQEFHVPNTDMSIRQFVVHYTQYGETEQVGRERIRFYIPDAAGQRIEEAHTKNQALNFGKNTGAEDPVAMVNRVLDQYEKDLAAGGGVLRPSKAATDTDTDGPPPPPPPPRTSAGGPGAASQSGDAPPPPLPPPRQVRSLLDELEEGEEGHPFGGWETVEVKEVDVAAEEEAKEKHAKLLESHRTGVPLEGEEHATAARNALAEADDLEGADSAYGAANPFGGAYKGVQLDAPVAAGNMDFYGGGAAGDEGGGKRKAVDGAVDGVEAEAVEFKRRKPNKAKKFRRKT